MRVRLLLLPLVLFAGSALAAPAKNRLTVDRYLDWEDVARPQLSPDGKQIVYERRWVDAIHDRWETALWIMNAAGSKNRFLVDGSSPRWSPDGSRLTYLADGEPEGTQVFVRWMDAEGAVSQVTRVREKPSNIAWSPDGRSIAFQMVVPPENGRWSIDMPKPPKGAEWTDPLKIVEKLHYRSDRIGYLPDGFRHLFVVSADGGTPHQVSNGDWHHDDFHWMPDGDSLVFRSLRIEDAEHAWRESDIYSVDIESGYVKQLTDRQGPDRGPVPSLDGRYIAYLGHDATDDTYIEEGLYVMNADGSDRRVIATEMGSRPRNLLWAADGSGVYFTAQLKGTSNLFFASLDGALRPVTDGDHMVSVTDMQSGWAVGTLTSSYVPRNLVAFDLDRASELTTLHATNRGVLAEVELGEVEEIWYDSVDDFRIQGWIVKPPDFDPSKRYPLILRIHGGPHYMDHTGFDFKNQNHAANGYVVLYTNPRGSSGYGSPFGNAIENAYPDKDYHDLMMGVDEILSRGYIDERNLFVYGGSGGGVLTAWVVGHTNRFTAAVSKAPVTNWLSFVGTTDGSGWYRNFDALPWDDPSEYLRRSPLMYVGNVTTPTMLLTGEKDLPDADGADGAILPGSQAAQDPDRHDPIDRRLAQPKPPADESHARPALSQELVRAIHGERGRGHGRPLSPNVVKNFARRGFRLRDGVGVYPARQRALRMVKSKAAQSLFEKENIEVGFRENGTEIRAGAALFNTKSDIDHLLATMKTLAPA